LKQTINNLKGKIKEYGFIFKDINKIEEKINCEIEKMNYDLENNYDKLTSKQKNTFEGFKNKIYEKINMYEKFKSKIVTKIKIMESHYNFYNVIYESIMKYSKQ
ncbi:hypothetical protein JW949_00270, partial [Candidatus Woesearchaeota archaeon]|nr:hypothetical protein [Candidatus Woesearchaeota archaeon]